MIREVKNLSILLFFVIMLSLIFILTILNLTFAQDIPKNIIIEHDIHRLDMFGPVHFGHQLHIESAITCKKCHHEWDEYSYDLPITCVNCHGRDNVQDVVSLRTAFMKQCLGCHIIQRPDGQKTGPTICTVCHQYKR